jgi:hypothetical protein
MCGRVRLDNDYSEIKIRLKFAPNAPAPNFTTACRSSRARATGRNGLARKPATEPELLALLRPCRMNG